MENREMKKRAYLIIALMVIVGVLLIATLIFIWTPKKENIKGMKLGEFSLSVDNENTLLDSYVFEINNLLKSKDIYSIYKIMNKDYLAEKGVNKDNLEQFLNSKNLLGNDLVISENASGSINNENYSRLKVMSTTSLVDEYMIVRELSPRIYQIAFDDYIYKVENVNKEYVQNKVYVRINSVDFGASSYKMNITIRNENSSTIKVNAKKLQEFVYGLHSSLGEIQSTASFAAGRDIDLKQNEEISLPVTFKISNLTHGKMIGFIIKDVQIDGREELENINLKLAD